MSRSVVHAGIAALVLLASVSNAVADDRPLTTESPDRSRLLASKSVRYGLASRPRYFVRGFVQEITVDVVVRVLHPDGSTLRRIDTSQRGRERFQFETEQEGRYIVEVSSPDSTEGEFKISLERLEPIAEKPEVLADQLLSAYASDTSPGVAINVFKDGNVLFSKAYGMANLTHAVPFTLDTPTNIGSTSKQFTAFAILLLCEDGQLSLDDDVRTHIPELPDFGDVVKVRHLLTHTTGYREFLNLIALTGRRLDRGDSIDPREIVSIVQRQPRLQNPPGGEFNYNNTAFSLAAEIVSRVSEQSFPEFMNRRIFDPLEMHHTQVRPSPSHIVPGRSQGYLPGENGSFVIARDISAAMGAGGIYSTVGDLQKWIENFSDPKLGTPELIQKMLTETKLNNGEGTGYGLGLFLGEHRGLRWVHHRGADSAHRSHLSYYPTINAGITTQSNHAEFDGAIASRLAEAFFSEQMDPEESPNPEVEVLPFDPKSYQPESFDRNIGRFALDDNPDFVITITRDEEKFYAEATGQGRYQIEPISETRFRLTDIDAQLAFHPDEKGNVDTIVLHQDGAELPAKRIKSEAWEPNTEELDLFIGRYFSDELETFYDFSINENGELQVTHRRLETRVLVPGSIDSFSSDGVSFEFERDRNGLVIGFYASNGRTRDVRFRRTP